MRKVPTFGMVVCAAISALAFVTGDLVAAGLFFLCAVLLAANAGRPENSEYEL